jgi:hypothetical protein
VSVFKISEGSTGSLDDLRKRTSNSETVKQTCNLYNVLTVVFVWVIVALCKFSACRSNSDLRHSIALFYILYFVSLAKVASWRNPDVWHSQVAKFDWSVTSADYIDPRSLRRPGNPQMEKSSEKSTPTDPYFEPNFVNPFSNAPIDDFAPQFAIVHPPRPRGQALDRHQLMNRYAHEPETPKSQKMSTRSTRGFGSTNSSYGTTFEDFDARQLAAMKLDGKTPEQTRIEKNKPQLSVRVPPPSQPVTRLSTGGNVRPKSQVGREQEHMPFQGSFSSEGGGAMTPDPSSVPNIPPLHMSFLNQGFSPLYKSPLDEPQNLALHSVLAPHRYPDIVRSPNRKSTKIVPGSVPHLYPQAEPRTMTPAAPSGAVLPMHSGDLHTSRPRRVPVPRDSTLPPPKARTPTTPEICQAQVRRAQMERQSKMHGPRSLSGPAHSRSSSNQTWPPHAKQNRHVPIGSTGSIPSDPASAGPRGPWSPPGLTTRPNSQHRPGSVYESRMPPKGWHYPSSSTSWDPSTIPSLSSSAPTNDTRYPSIPPAVVSKTSRTIAGTEDQAFGTPTNSDHLPSSYESTQATWQQLDEQFRLKYGMDDKRSSRGKLRKPNPRVFNDTL